MKKIAFFSTHFRYYLEKSGYFGYSVIEPPISLINNRLQITGLEIATGYWSRKSGYWKSKTIFKSIRERVIETFAAQSAALQSFSRSLAKQTQYPGA
jgi:hypothetical protein